MTPVIGPSEGLNAAVAAELRAALARKKWSVNRLSEEAEIPYGSLRRYLNAERHIDVSVLYALCWAIGVRPQEIVTVAEQNVSDPAPSLRAVANEGDLEGAGEFGD